MLVVRGANQVEFIAREGFSVCILQCNDIDPWFRGEFEYGLYTMVAARMHLLRRVGRVNRMIPVYRDNRIGVYDDFLLSGEQESILEYLDSEKGNQRMSPDAWGDAFRLIKGKPLMGVKVQVLTDTVASIHQTLADPKDTVARIFVRRLFECKAVISEIIGQHGEEWTHFTMCPYIYPAGSSLAWHTDKHAAGAYVYYPHRAWGVDWGGELHVESAQRSCAKNVAPGQGISKKEALEAVLKNGMGNYFAPLPNRLVFLRGGTPHAIKRVDDAAGDNARLSIAGFFMSV